MSYISAVCYILGQIAFMPVYFVATERTEGRKLSLRQIVHYILISPHFIVNYAAILYTLYLLITGTHVEHAMVRSMISYASVFGILFAVPAAFVYARRCTGKLKMLRLYIYGCFYVSSMVFSVLYVTPTIVLLHGVIIPYLFAFLLYRALAVPMKELVGSIKYYYSTMLTVPAAAVLLLVLRFSLEAYVGSQETLSAYARFLAEYSTAFGYLVFGFVLIGAALLKRNMRSILAIDDDRKQLALANEKLGRFSVDTLQALAAAVDAKDAYTNGHSERVALYSGMIAQKLGYPDDRVEVVRNAALVHDIGKIGVADGIIKKAARLTDEEYASIKSHPTKGADILSTLEYMPELRIAALYHHERWDGKGYPSGVAGEDIPELARIISVADAYDAMSRSRVYRSALTPETVRNEIERGLGTQFDPNIGKVMLELIDSGALEECAAG